MYISYAGAIDALEKILVLVPNDEAALAHLVIAASNVNEVKAKEVAKKLPSLPGSDSLDPVELEALPAAKRRERMIEIGSKRSKKAEEGEAVASDGVVGPNSEACLDNYQRVLITNNSVIHV